MINLKGKTAIITGASRGIGAAAAILFAKAGVSGLVINYHRDLDSAKTWLMSAKGTARGF